MKKVSVTKEEQQLSYYKYFTREMAKIPAEKLEVLNGGASKVPAVPFTKKELFLKGEDQDYCQTGYGIMEDGTGFVCNTTYMPGVTGEMLDWWFPWHSVGADLRYKIWDPEDHYFAKAHDAAYVCDPAVPNREKTWGMSHYIIEDIGDGPDALKLNFLRPSDFGYDESLIGTPACSSMVCAVGEGKCAAAVTHKWFPYQEGVLFCSRFWIGMARIDGEIIKVVPDGASVPEIVAKGLFAHNIKEFTNLAAILPEVYAENKDNF